MNTLLIGLETGTLSEEEVNQIKALSNFQYQLLITKNKDEIRHSIEQIEIVLGSIPRTLLPSAKSLRWLQQWGAGADWLLRYPEAADMDFVLTNASGVHPIPVTEHVFGMLLMLARNLHKALDAQRQGIWVGNRWHISPDRLGAKQAAVSFGPNDVFELAGKTMLIVGLGAIGEQITLVANAFGMTVHGVRKRPFLSQPAPHITTVITPDRLHDLLPEADVVVVTVPHTTETDKMFNTAVFRAMKRSSIFMNIGRGGTVNERDLIYALKHGHIAAAALDVFEEEPLPADSPLWQLDNVLLTSHYSAITPHYDRRAFEIFMDNFDRYLNGRPLRNVVDKKAGY